VKPGEGSGPIQIIPPGLLGLLQLKSPAGQNPHVLNHDVQPSIDLQPWWLRANRQVWGPNSGLTVAAAVINDFQAFSPNAIIVPQNQWWYVHSYSMSAASSAGGTAQGLRQAMRWNTVGTIKYRALGENESNVSAALGARLIGATDFWMPPGSELGFWIGSVLVADLGVTLRGLDYTVLPI